MTFRKEKYTTEKKSLVLTTVKERMFDTIKPFSVINAHRSVPVSWQIA